MSNLLNEYDLERWHSLGRDPIQYFREGRPDQRQFKVGYSIKHETDGNQDLCICSFVDDPKHFFVIPSDEASDNNDEFPIGPFSTRDEALRAAVVLLRMEVT